MDIEAFAGTLTNLLIKHLPRLIRGEDAEASAGHNADDRLPAVVHLLWQRLQPKKAAGLPALLNALAASPDPADIQTLRHHVQQMLSKDLALARSLQYLVALGPDGVPAGQPQRDPWEQVLAKDRKAVRRLEMLYALRAGKTAGEVAAGFNISVQELFALNARFCTAGVAGALNDDAETWLERLNVGDTVLRRLDMIYLVRCGTPASAVAEQYGAPPEYVERIVRRFEKSGVPGILTEKDMEHFHALYPPALLRVCSYNLHGADDAGPPRFRRIAAQLAYADAHIAALQEVVSGSGIENTGAQIARWVSSMTGESYTSEFAYCHQFMEKYPEGIGIATRFRPKAMRSLDLTELRDGLRPALPRKALVMVADAGGRTAAVASVHLDHITDPQVRLAQAEKLVRELEEQGGNTPDYLVLAGDFNDADDSPAIRFLLSAGYRDAYRACNKDTGNTYPAGNPTTRIDYIFVKGAIEVRSSGLLANDPELSDHIGIFAEIA